MNQQPNLPAEIHEQIFQLYRSPQNLRIVEIAKADEAPLDNFVEAISADPVFDARLIKLANFVPGLAQGLTTLANAINVFGLDNLKVLALGLSSFTDEPAQETGEKSVAEEELINLRDLWEHALGCAAVAARLAAKIEGVSTLSAFVGGLIHDVGKVLLYRYSRERFIAAISVALEKNIPSTEGEMLAFGIDHVTAAEEWCRKFELPLALQNVLRLHHERPSILADSIDDESQRLIATIQAADLICESQNIGKAGDWGLLPRQVRAALDFHEDDWRDVLSAVKREVESARQTFGFQRQGGRKLPLVRGRAGRNQALPLSKRTAGHGRALVVPFPSRNEGRVRHDAKQTLGKLAILVVEDHTSLCDLLSLYLMRRGYHVRTASNGEGALAILSKEEIPLMLLDLMLPRVDGFEVLRQIHKSQHDKTPYIIVVSAGASEKDRQKVLELGADEYMPGPFHLMRLLERIQVVQKYLL